METHRGQDITSSQSHKSYRPFTVLAFRLTHRAWGVITAVAPHITQLVPRAAPLHDTLEGDGSSERPPGRYLSRLSLNHSWETGWVRLTAASTCSLCQHPLFFSCGALQVCTPSPSMYCVLPCMLLPACWCWPSVSTSWQCWRSAAVATLHQLQQPPPPLAPAAPPAQDSNSSSALLRARIPSGSTSLSCGGCP